MSARTKKDFENSVTFWKDLSEMQTDRIAQLEAENKRLERIIAKELTENDELGSEFVYVGALKAQNKQLREALKSLSDEAFKQLNKRKPEPVSLYGICMARQALEETP